MRLISLLLLFSTLAHAQERLLTIDDLYDPNKKLNFSGIPQASFTWIDDKSFIWPRRDAAGDVIEWLVVDAASGKSKLLFDRERMEGALRKVAGVTSSEAKKIAGSRSFTMNPRYTATLLSISNDLFLYTFDSGSLVRLTFSPVEEKEFTFSPDGSAIAFVRDNDLFVYDIDEKREHALTTNGSAEVLNGILDWVYQEEIYGRGHFRAYWWSPDSTTLAFLQLHEGPVPEFTVVDHIPYRQNVEITDYPKAGDPNPTVKLFVARASGGQPRAIDLEKYTSGEFLIVNVDWHPGSEKVVFQVQNREQTWLDLNLGDRASGDVTTLLRETTPAWVNENGSPRWLNDGSFLWFSERDGWKHIYHYKGDGTLIRKVTDGKWEARTLHGADEKNQWIYLSGTERSHIGSDVYRIRFDGSGLQRLSSAEGTHSALFSEKFTYFIDQWSDVHTPPQAHLHRSADGSLLRTLEKNPVPLLGEFAFSKPEFLQVKTRDGFVMEAIMIKPAMFDPSKKYPVYQQTYAGPHAQTVRNAWQGTTGIFHQLLAQRGIIVWMCDNRTASGKGIESTWPIYKVAGEPELRDIEDGITWLKQQPYVDASRIMLNGWSYGGFMVSYALTHSKSFAAGIAGGSVTDWRDYDSIYTERYMLMPQNNPEGYKRTAPRNAAADLHGNLLLIHGTIDDNVHMQNTIQFAYDLQKAGKQFELMLYPKSRHGVTDPALVRHMRTLMLEFVMKNLKP